MGFGYRTIDVKPLGKGIAWIGMAIVLLGAVVSFGMSWTMTQPPPTTRGGVNFGHPIAFVIGAFGILLMFIGRALAKPRYFWLVSIVIGSLYVVSFFGLIPGWYGFARQGRLEMVLKEALTGLVLILPGAVCVLYGIVLRKVGERRQPEH